MKEGPHEGKCVQGSMKVIRLPCCVSARIRLPNNNSFNKWKYIFLLGKRSPEVEKLRLVWQLIGLRGLGLLLFCSTSLKFTSWPKIAAGALGIMSAFQASGRKKGQKAKGIHFSARAAPFTEFSKNFCTTPNLWSQGYSLAVGWGAGNVMFWLDALPF